MCARRQLPPVITHDVGPRVSARRPVCCWTCAHCLCTLRECHVTQRSHSKHLQGAGIAAGRVLSARQGSKVERVKACIPAEVRIS